MSTILVTGGAGYLGSGLIRHLAEQPMFKNHRIRIFDNMFRERYAALTGLQPGATYGTRFRFTEGDVRDPDALKKAMEDVEIVFSLADITNAPVSFKRERLTWDTNYRGAMNVFRAAAEADVKKFVYTSTCSVYGPTDDKVDEESECEPASPYGQSKLVAENMMQYKADEMGFDWTALRLATVHGWTPGIRFDTVINRFSWLASIGAPLQVYESAWKEKRPYVHVRDVMDAYVLAATGSTVTAHEVYNVVGINADMEDVIRAIRHGARWNALPTVQVETVETPSLNQLSYVVDGMKFYKAGFSPKAALEDGPIDMMTKFKHLAPHIRPSEKV